jgi:hypothetical protein
MALHQDIHWVGRQWAVTGYGMQACDQKQKGKFDIEIARLWDDGFLENVRAQKWLNAKDFDKALSVARARYREPPEKAQQRQARAARVEDSAPAVVVKPVLRKFHLRIEHASARFVPQWRIRMQR